jgi:glycosyltransferase involved in cell wall biosynthesis
MSTDGTAEIAASLGAEVVPFEYDGGFPKKRQWVLERIAIATPWVLMLDADESVPDNLWWEIRTAIESPRPAVGYLIEKGFCFLGRQFRFGGFSHEAVLLFQTGRANFERLEAVAETGLDMEIHERLIVDGPIRRMQTPLIHEDLKGLSAYIDRHNRYSTWEAAIRYRYLNTKTWGSAAITPRLFGNCQERRRFLKQLACQLPFEPWLWFIYHYLIRLGLLEGAPGLISSQIRAQYIANVRAKIHELNLSKQRAAPVLADQPLTHVP